LRQWGFVHRDPLITPPDIDETLVIQWREVLVIICAAHFAAVSTAVIISVRLSSDTPPHSLADHPESAGLNPSMIR